MRPKLIGRARELAAVERAFVREGERLVTLTGPGGVGKTRLAREVAETLSGHLADGAIWIDLASVADPGDVLVSVAEGVSVRDTGRQPLQVSVVHALRARELLLVLDNVEQVAAAAPDLAALLHDCRGVRMLVTSREPLRLLDEHLVVLEPLDLPTTGDIEDPATAPAVALFLECARRAGVEISRTTENVAAVVDICRRVDGLPLAIELAAAWARVLPPAVLAEKLDRDLNWLAGRERDRPPRHQTLRAALDWSHALLTESERILFRRLAVFSSEIDVEALEAVCGPPDPGADLLVTARRLVECSLVVPVESGLRLLETTRVYALEQLALSGEAGQMRERHAAYFLGLARRAALEVRSPRQKQAIDHLDREHANIGAALRWLVDSHQFERAAELCWALWPYWWFRGRIVEAIEWLTQVRMLDEDAGATEMWRARVRGALGGMLYERGDYATAGAALEEARGFFERAESRDGLGVVLMVQGYIALADGDVAAAESLLLQALDQARLEHDDSTEAMVLTALGVVALIAGQPTEALERLESSAARGATSAPLLRAHALANIGWISCGLDQRQRLRGRAALSESIELAESLGNDETLAFSVEAMAGLLVSVEGEADRAGRLLGAAEALREVVAAPIWGAQRAIYDAIVERVRSQLGAAATARAWSEGRRLTRARIVELALGESVATSHASLLSAREREVAALIAEGCTSKEIADRLVITEATADTHAAHIRTKLGLRSRAEIATWFTRHATEQPMA